MNQQFLNTTNQTVAWFLKRLRDNELQLKAPFQRNPVWTTKQKAYLIDSILRGFPIPELYMQQFTDAHGDDRYIVVDGQQRLRACFEFIEGNYSLNREESEEWADLYFDDLSPEDKKIIYNYNFVIRVLPEMHETDLRAMFRRLNKNVVALNQQELRHATYWGEFITCVEKISDDERWSELGLFSPNDVRRMLDVEFISEIAVGFLHGVQNKKEKLEDYYAIYEVEFEDRSRLERVFNVVIGEILAFLPDIISTRWRKKSDFYTLFLCMADNYKHLPLSREQRSALRTRIKTFGADVDRFIKDPDSNDDVSSDVKIYSSNVERAASDLANRRTRRDCLCPILNAIIAGIFSGDQFELH